jgi:hypothetical protein
MDQLDIDRFSIATWPSLLLAALALVISVIALYFTALQSKDTHNQLLLSMKPSGDFDTETDTDDLPVGITLSNAGPGPAVIKSLTYYVDKKVIGDVDKLIDFANLDNVPTYNLEDGDTLAVGESHWLVSYKDKPHGKDDQQQLDKFVDYLEHHLAIEVQFCPVLPGECATKCSSKDWCK